MEWGDFEVDGSSADFGVVEREVSLKDRLRDELILGSEADVEVEPFLSGVGADEEDLRVKDNPKKEGKTNLRLMEEGVSERGKWWSSES